ncbi:MAG: nucleotidyltransferase domain-containing protein [Chloroflexaceae bacterium]|nr:nucleotidyltransferase domain-containing protein [Chloroflexaceae bacterium]
MIELRVRQLMPLSGPLLNGWFTDYQPERIVLFGSFAAGEPDADSDIDLLIIKTTTESPLERRVRVRRLVADPERRVLFSPLVLTPEALERRLALGDPFYQDILVRGKTLYVHN